MINSVFITVQALLNKSNFGYLSPQDFNQFGKMAQLQLFEGLMEDYNSYVNMQNKGMLGVGYADLLKEIEEDIEDFVVDLAALTHTANAWDIPSDCYKVENLYRYDATSGANYPYRAIEKVGHREARLIINSDMAAPAEDWAIYTLAGGVATVYPSTLDQDGDVVATYIRYPLDPKWTYTTLSGGAPIFNQSAGDYQDFELSQAYEPKLIVKICQYAGLSIREPEVMQFMKTEEIIEKQEMGGA